MLRYFVVGQWFRGVSAGFVCALALACGDAGDVTDGGDEDVVDASAVDAPLEGASRPDASKDAKADTGKPPLVCKGEMSEPNESEVFATPLGTIDDCDGSGSTVSGVSSGTNDVDWLRFQGTDTFGCSVNPTVKLSTSGLRLCAFALCDNGTTDLQDCGIGTNTTSPAGMHGCCTSSTQSMDLQINCSTTKDSADIFIRVDQPNGNACVAYDVAYHY